MSALRRYLRRPCGACLVLASGLLMAGCHTYTPVNTAPPGSTVRVQIPVRSAADDPNAPPRTQSVEGQVLSSGDTIVLATSSRYEYGAYREIMQYDTLRLGPEERYTVELREFSRGRSVALGLGLTALVAGAAAVAFGGTFGSGGDGNNVDPPAPAVVSVPVHRSLVDSFLGLLLGN